jgi:hypothetical protein
MPEKAQVRKSIFSARNMEDLGRLYENDTPAPAYDLKKQMDPRSEPPEK